MCGCLASGRHQARRPGRGEHHRRRHRIERRAHRDAQPHAGRRRAPQPRADGDVRALSGVRTEGVLMRTVTLNNGVEMPILGFGVYQVPADQTEHVVAQALDSGYRHIDTAASYQNEGAVGRAIATSGVARDDLFVTTKLEMAHAGYEATQ